MKITIEPTAEFFRTDEGWPVRAWRGLTEGGEPVVAFVAAVTATSAAGSAELHSALQEIPGPDPSGRVMFRGVPYIETNNQG
jgi:hypothetical protein